jgi:GntR family transcriptional regulator/MocR family aminotransferase
MHRIDIKPQGVAAGLHALLELPAGRSEHDVIRQCADKGLAVEGLGRYHLQKPTQQALVVGYATPPEHSYSGALARLVAALKS